ncbi:MAG: Na/Pi cotransporter family protein, partial [Vulcanimicrobiota bacterium]
MIIELLSLAGGLALLIFGMMIFSNGLQKLLSEYLRKPLEEPGANRFKTFFDGILTTLVVQSSSRSIITLIGLINAGVFTLIQGTPFILGANVGTALITEIAAFNIGQISLLFVALGFLINMFTEKNEEEKWASLGTASLGFGIFFLGIFIMNEYIHELAIMPHFTDAVHAIGSIPAQALVVSILFTIVIQNSAATVILSMFLATGGVIDLKTALLFMLGSNIGTTFPVIFAANYKKSRTLAKRGSFVHLLTKVAGVLVALYFIDFFTGIVSSTPGSISRQVANGHLIFNLFIAIVFC